MTDHEIDQLRKRLVMESMDALHGFDRRVRTLTVHAMILSMWIAGLFGLWHSWTAR